MARGGLSIARTTTRDTQTDPAAEHSLQTLWRRSTRATRLRYHQISFVPLTTSQIDAWNVPTRAYAVYPRITGELNRSATLRQRRSQALPVDVFVDFELPDGGSVPACTPASANLTNIQRCALTTRRCRCSMWVRLFQPSLIVACALRVPCSGADYMCYRGTIRSFAAYPCLIVRKDAFHNALVHVHALGAISTR